MSGGTGGLSECIDADGRIQPQQFSASNQRGIGDCYSSDGDWFPDLSDSRTSGADCLNSGRGWGRLVHVPVLPLH